MKIKLINQLKNILFIIMGTFILAFGVGIFLLPSNVLSGGVAGVSVLLEPFVPISKIAIVTIVTYTLFIVGAILLGKKFAMQTILSSLLYPVFLSLIESHVATIPVPNFLAAIYGGVISGVGIAIVLRTGASTGGMDIPPLIIHKFTGIEIGSLVMIVDTITVLCGLYVYGLEAVLVGLISVYTCSIAITKTMAFPGSSAKSVQIISDYWEAINQKINHEMDRGTTLLAAQGGYTGDKKKVILVVLNNNEYSKLLSIIDEIDSNAFMIVSETTEVHGEGFTIEARI